MKSTSIAVLSLLLLAACGKEPAANQTAPDATAGAPAVAAASCPAGTVTGYEVLPPGVTVDVPFHLRGDRIVADKKGNYRRRVTFEYLSGDANSVFDSLVQSFSAAGFQPKVKREKDGRMSIGFNKKGVGSVLLAVNPVAVPKPAHPDAKGMFALDYPYQGKVEAVPTQEATAP